MKTKTIDKKDFDLICSQTVEKFPDYFKDVNQEGKVKLDECYMVGSDSNLGISGVVYDEYINLLPKEIQSYFFNEIEKYSY